MYIVETTDGFGRGSIVIIALNLFMIGMMTVGFILDRKQKNTDAKKKGGEIERNYDDYAEAKQNNSASIEMKHVRQIVSPPPPNSDAKLNNGNSGVFESSNDRVVVDA